MISVCIFGSQARETADPLSDRDLLVIAGEEASLDQEVKYWTAQRWNVSTFERSAFARIAEVQSLFVQHIKLEGRIVKDDDGFLAGVLESYLPKSDYKGERNDALRQIASLPSPKGIYWHDMCLADAMYVLLRNAIILHLACEKAYCFQYDELATRFSDEFGLTSDERSHLLTLRDLKHAFRRRALGYNPEKTIYFVEKLTKRLTLSICDSRISSISLGKTSNDYLKLRITELELLSKYDIFYLDNIKKDHFLFDVWKKIKGAKGYPKPRIRANCPSHILS